MGIVAGSLYAPDGGILAGSLLYAEDQIPAQFTAGLSVSNVTQTALRVGFTVDEAAQVYGIVVPQGSAVPTPQQIIAGADYGAVTVLSTFDVAAVADVAQTADFANIVGYAGQSVRAYVTALDVAGNVQQQADILTTLVQLQPAVTPDTTPPVITLEGPNPFTLIVGTEYVEQGYNAVDNVDGLIPQDAPGRWTVTPNFNPNAVGVGSISYVCVDANGNSAQATRLINVVSNIPPDLYPVITRRKEIVSGDDFEFTFQLRELDGSIPNLSGAVITAGIVNLRHDTEYCEHLQESTALWSQGAVTIRFPASKTRLVKYLIPTDVIIEIDVFQNGSHRTWFEEIQFTPGNVS